MAPEIMESSQGSDDIRVQILTPEYGVSEQAAGDTQTPLYAFDCYESEYDIRPSFCGKDADGNKRYCHCDSHGTIYGLCDLYMCDAKNASRVFLWTKRPCHRQKYGNKDNEIRCGFSTPSI